MGHLHCWQAGSVNDSYTQTMLTSGRGLTRLITEFLKNRVGEYRFVPTDVYSAPAPLS
jgi:hypothetical protein